MTRLSPMDEAQYQAFVADAVPDFAADKVASGDWHPAQALALSQTAFDGLLPLGLATPGNHLYTIVDDDTEEVVGSMWIAVQQRAGQPVAYLYDVAIRPEHRRQGHARRAFLALEREVARLGLAGIALHVFGHNTAARALYERLGYETTDLNLYKPVDG